MALEDNMKQQVQQPVPQQATAPEQQPSNKLSEEEETDLKIAVLLAERLIDEGGIKVIDDAVKTSNDPGQVIGQFLMQMVSQMSEQLPKEIQLSKRIYFAHGGWVEQISDYLQEQYGIDKKIMDRAEIYIATAAQKMAQGQKQQAAQGQPPQAGVPGGQAMPQQGGMA